MGRIPQHQLRFPQKLPTELPHCIHKSRSRILHIRCAIRRTIHHTHPPLSLLMHNIERKRFRQHIKLIPYSSLPLFIRTRQSQQINPLYFVAPIIDKSLVKQKHILRILHHHIPFVHSFHSFHPTALANHSRSISSEHSVQAVDTSYYSHTTTLNSSNIPHMLRRFPLSMRTHVPHHAVSQLLLVLRSHIHRPALYNHASILRHRTVQKGSAVR